MRLRSRASRPELWSSELQGVLHSHLKKKMGRKYRSKFQQKTLLNIINEAKTLYDRKLFTDVTLQCEGQEFAAHKVILIANSQYFREYFIQNENVQNVTIDFMTSEVLQIILEYFYTGRIIVDKQQTQRLLKSLLEVSTILQIPLLSNYCLELILNKKSSDLSLSDWKVIIKFNSQAVLEIYLQTIIKKLNLLNTTESFLKLSINQMYVLFQCPAVAESDQNIVFQSILNWIKYDSDERKEQLTQFLETLVDWQKLNLEFLKELEKEPLLTENSCFLKSCFKLMCHKKNRETDKVIKRKTSQGLKPTLSKFQDPLNVKTCKKLKQNKSKILCVENDAAFKNPTCSVLGERKFFIYGSKAKKTGEILIHLYDYVQDKLERMVAHPLFSGEGAAILFYDGNIYAFGHQCLEVAVSKAVFSYNMETKQWLEKKSMINYKFKSAAVELNGYVYVVGGIDQKRHFLRCMERYYPATDQWNTVAELPDVTEDIVPVVAVNDCLYIVLKNKLYKYIPEDDKWDFVDIQLDKCLEGKIYMSGGNDKIFIIEKKAPKSVWIYDSKENSLSEDVIPSILTECDGLLNLENPGNLEFLVSGNGKWFIYRPPYSWLPFDPKKLKDFDISMLTVISKD